MSILGGHSSDSLTTQSQVTPSNLTCMGTEAQVWLSTEPWRSSSGGGHLHISDSEPAFQKGNSCGWLQSHAPLPRLWGLGTPRILSVNTSCLCYLVCPAEIGVFLSVDLFYKSEKAPAMYCLFLFDKDTWHSILGHPPVCQFHGYITEVVAVASIPLSFWSQNRVPLLAQVDSLGHPLVNLLFCRWGRDT